jgi:uncharacterized protein YcbX
MERIGTIARVRRYPVKSMAGEDLGEAQVTRWGLAGDRVYAFIDERNRSDFPWMTGRQGRDMILFRARFLAPPPQPKGNGNPPAAEVYALEVTTPEGRKFRMGTDEFTAFLAARYARPLRLRFSEQSMTDAQPVSIFGLGTVGALSGETGIDLDARRFRANFYAQWNEDRPFYEDELVGRALRIGDSVELRVIKKNERCVMINLDPETAAASPVVLETVARRHDSCAGVYAQVLREGIVRVGDAIQAI